MPIISFIRIRYEGHSLPAAAESSADYIVLGRLASAPRLPGVTVPPVTGRHITLATSLRLTAAKPRGYIA